jgi:hypothetical protein
MLSIIPSAELLQILPPLRERGRNTERKRIERKRIEMESEGMGIGAREKGRQTERATQASRHTPRGI